MEKKNIIECTNCESNKVQVTSVAVIMFGIGGTLLWIPIVGWVLAPFFLLFGLIAGLSKGKKFKCKECNHMFTVDNETYKAYKAKLYGKAPLK